MLNPVRSSMERSASQTLQTAPVPCDSFSGPQVLSCWKSFRSWLPAALGSLLLANSAWAADVVVRTHQTPDGAAIGAVSLPYEGSLPVRAAVNHVVLFDTSASQVGEHRKFGAEVLEAFLQQLPESDRVTVLAYDVATSPLTGSQVSPAAALAEVKATLASRFPAGASNLANALQGAGEQLQGTKNGSVLIIGDGMSVAHLFQPEELKALTAQFRGRQIPIHSLAVGAKTDLRLLGILGEQTGGFVARDDSANDAQNSQLMGRALADASRRQVFYPTTVAVEPKSVQLVGTQPLPMRTDRETVYLVTGEIPAGTTISVGGTVGANPAQVQYTLPKAVRTEGNTFLAPFWKDATSSDGLVVGFAGDWMVNYAHQSFEDYVMLVSAEGDQALQSGSYQIAERNGELLTSIDPENPRGAALVKASRDRGMGLLAQADAPVPPPPPAPKSPLDERELPAPNSNIEGYEALRDAKGQKLQRQVEIEIQEANRLLDNALGAQAEDLLNRVRTTIKSATDIAPELRNNLLRLVTNSLQDVRARRAQYDATAQELQRLRAEAEVTARLIDFQTERDLQLVQMVDRIRALMEQAYQGDTEAYASAEAQARQLLNSYPGTAIGIAEVFTTEAATQVDNARRLRDLRSDRLLDVLHQVELAHVPFPDNPPIRYPSAETWWALTENRQKWKSVDLQFSSKNEEKIYRELEKNTSIEFPANPLNDALQYLSQQHGIPIIVKKDKLSEEGLTGEEEISLVLNGIKLKSALKLMLSSVGGVELTYIIKDEVMQITTVTDASELREFRIYPIGELMDLQPMGGGMGGMMGGMGGGMGGMGGGMGF